MSRKYVTREVVEYHRIVKIIDLATDKVEEKEYVNCPIRMIQRELSENNKRFISIVKELKTKKLVGVDLDTFVSISVDLDPKTRKPIKGED